MSNTQQKNDENHSNGIIKSIGILTIIMAVSKVLSLVRELAIASFYGASSSTDAYFVAGGFVTNVFFGIATALSTVFLPYYVMLKKEKTFEERSEEVSSIMVSLSSFAALIIIILFILAPTIIRLIAPSYTGKQFEEAVLYMRIYSISILFSLLVNMLTSLLNAERRYGFGAIASVVYSVTSIVCMIVLQKAIGVAALAISVPLAFFIQMIILLFAIRRHIRFVPNFYVLNPAVKNLVILMVPVLLSNATIEINQLLTRSITTTLDQGSVSILSYTNTLFNFVSSLMSTTFITVYFTEMSSAAEEDNKELFNSKVSQAVNILLVVILPIAAITMIYSKDIVFIAYGRGKFDQKSVLLTAQCLSIYSTIFLFDCIRNLLIKAFYSKKNTKTPLINSIISMMITVAGSFVLSRIMGLNGIVIAMCISTIVTTVFLAISARHQLCKFDRQKITDTAVKAFGSIIVVLALLVVLNTLTVELGSIIRFALACVIGFGTYLLFLALVKCKEVNIIMTMLKRKRHKA